MAAANAPITMKEALTVRLSGVLPSGVGDFLSDFGNDFCLGLEPFSGGFFWVLEDFWGDFGVE